MKNYAVKATLLAMTLFLGVLLTLTSCAVDEVASAPDINNPSPSGPDINNPSPSGPNPSGPRTPEPSEPILAGVAYKPFAGHKNKFSLGDFDSPYLVRLDDYTNFVASNSRILLNDAPHQITKTNYQGNTYVGIAGFDFNDYSTFTGTFTGNNNALTIKVSLATTNGSAITNGAVASRLMVTAPTLIYTWQDLQGMKHDLAGEYELRSDITFPDKGNQGLAAAGFEPVGDDSAGNHFTGSFAGNRHAIANLSIDRPGRDRLGIWGYVNSADSVIKDFVVDHAGIEGNNRVGSVVGQLHAGIVTNVGMMSSGGMRVSGFSRIGGLVGYNFGARSTVNGYARGDVTGTGVGSFNIGGLVGDNESGVVSGYVTGAVSGKGNIGGLVGESSRDGRVHGYATGDVTGSFRIGGLVGFNDGATATGYATGAVRGNHDVGGLVGHNHAGVANGYATGAVTGNSEVGGLVGDSRVDGGVNGYWDQARSGEDDAVGGGDFMFDGAGISAIANVVYDSGAGTYTDTGNGNAMVFTNAAFLRLFDLPRANNVTWPDLKVVP